MNKILIIFYVKLACIKNKLTTKNGWVVYGIPHSHSKFLELGTKTIKTLMIQKTI